MLAHPARGVCMLPGGYLDADGTVHREAHLVTLSGREEELLAGAGGATTAALTTQILCRSVRRIGAIEPVTETVARRLLIADRQYLLLKLRELTFGGRIQGTLACPWPQCRAKVDIDFSIDDVPVERCHDIAAQYRLQLSDTDGAVRDEPDTSVVFRLPNGGDQEALVGILARNPAEALSALLRRCILSMPARPSDDGTGAGDAIEQLTARSRLEIEQAMEQFAPRIDLDMDLTCPECGRAFTTPFDLQDFFFGELRTSSDLLYRQVHYLAYHYHWSEREILELPRGKRLAYIDVLAEEIEAINSAG
jgi:hypothetical protein